jgi:hypothetical protein
MVEVIKAALTCEAHFFDSEKFALVSRLNIQNTFAKYGGYGLALELIFT